MASGVNRSSTPVFGADRVRAPICMRWEDSVLAMLEDLEHQAAGLHLADRAVEVDELSAAQYAEVELIARVHASVGDQLRVGTVDALELHGRLAAAGSDWAMLDDGQGSASIVHLAAIGVIGGLAPRPAAHEASSLSARLSLRSVLRGLAQEAEPVALHLQGGRTLQGDLVGVGADFVELRQGDVGDAVTVPLAAVTVVRARA